MRDDFDALLSGDGDPKPGGTAQPGSTAQPGATPQSQAAAQQGAQHPDAASPLASASAPPSGGRGRRALPWLVVAVVTVLAAGAVLWAFQSQGAPDADPTPPPVAEPSETPSEEPDPEPAPEPDRVSLPAECRDIFSDAYHAELASTGATLSDGNAGPRDFPFHSDDVPTIVESTIAEAPHLECVWSFANNFNVGISTVLAEVTDEEAVAIADALERAGFATLPELGSVRYIKEFAGDENFGPAGYSIIARDGLLVATHWLDWPATGYTADIVETVLGPLG